MGSGRLASFVWFVWFVVNKTAPAARTGPPV